MLCRAGPWGPPTSAAGSQTQCGRSHAALLAAARLLSPLRVGERRLPSPSPASSLPGGEAPPLGGPRPAPAPCPPPWSLKPSPKAQCSLAQLPGATHGPLHGPAAPLSVLSRRVGPQKLHALPPGAQRAAVAPSCGRSWRSAHALARRLFGGSDGPLHAQPSS